MFHYQLAHRFFFFLIGILEVYRGSGKFGGSRQFVGIMFVYGRTDVDDVVFV